MLVTYDGDAIAFRDFLGWLERQQTVAVDTETTGLNPFHESRIAGVVMASASESFYLPFGHEPGDNLPQEWLRPLLLLLVKKERLIFFNGSFDLNFLQRAGMSPLGAHQYEEVQVAGHLLNENDFNPRLGLGPAGLKELADKYLGPGQSRDETELQERVSDAFGKVWRRKKEWKGAIWRLPAAMVEPYACADGLLTMRLWKFYTAHLRRQDLWPLYRETCGLTLLLQEMSYRGVRIDRPLLEQNERETRLQALSLRDQLIERLGNPDFNPASSAQVQELFQMPSVTKMVLRQLSDRGDERARLLAAYRKADKLHGSYYEKYLPLLDSENRIHCNFNSTGTETGRLSCSKPNLQAIPRESEETEEALRVKQLFLPSEPGGTWVEMDYSLAELRLASFYGREYTMARFIAEGRDIHREMADRAGCERATAKRVNFSAVYGIGARTFVKNYGIELGIDIAEAQRVLGGFHALYPNFSRLYSQMERLAIRNGGKLILPNGRVRHYYVPPKLEPTPLDTSRHAVASMILFGETRKASSNLVQGMVMAVIAKAMLRIRREIPEMKLLLTVHDSLAFELPAGIEGRERDLLIAETRAIMEDPMPKDPAFRFYGWPDRPDCPMKVDVKVSDERWGKVQKWTPSGS